MKPHRSLGADPFEDGLAASGKLPTDEEHEFLKKTQPGATATTGEFPAMPDVDIELELADEIEALEADLEADPAPAPADEALEAEAFVETPTVSNRANPINSTDESGNTATPEGAGSYRLVRPATSDRIDVRQPSAGEKTASNRVIIGIARKPNG
jgi:hypothetical protein